MGEIFPVHLIVRFDYNPFLHLTSSHLERCAKAGLKHLLCTVFVQFDYKPLGWRKHCKDFPAHIQGVLTEPFLSVPMRNIWKAQ